MGFNSRAAREEAQSSGPSLRSIARAQSARIFQRFRAFRNHRLPHIYRRHLAAQLPEAPLNVSEDQIVELQFAAQKLGDGFARESSLRPSRPGDDQTPPAALL